MTSGANSSPPRLDLAAIRAKLEGVRGQEYWRSLDEVAETPEFREMIHREFPDGASEWIEKLDRRSFLKLATASLAVAGLTACTRQPAREILPYIRQPENLLLGEPLDYATTMILGGFGTGVLAKSREGHPIKVDGNPAHPASRGGSSIWVQASILDLYDPDRSQSFVRNGELSTWPLFLTELNGWMREHDRDHGAGLRFLTETVTSPTLAAELRSVFERFPKAKWHQYDAVTRDNVREGARLAFGEIVETQYRFDRSAVILSLDADFLYTHPQRLRHIRDFTDGRRVSAGQARMNRLYAVESTPSVTGTMADHRLPLAAGQIGDFAQYLALRIGQERGDSDGGTRNSGVKPPGSISGFAAEHAKWVEALVADLQRNRGKSIVVAGPWQGPVVHALAHWLNDQLGNNGNTVFYTESAEANPVNQLDSLRDLAQEVKARKVRTLFILGGNPVYSAPADLGFGELLNHVDRGVHVGLQIDETAAACTWHIPETHYLESWGDARSADGTISFQQPLIAPLYDGKSTLEVLDAMLREQPVRSDYEIVRDYWRGQKLWPDFEKGWRRALHDGLIANSALPEKRVRLQKRLEELLGSLRSGTPSDPNGPAHLEGSPIEVTFRPDPSVWDGRFANNGFLQECARPISKLTWDNAILISPALAQQYDLMTDDVVELSLNGRMVQGPVWIMPGQAAHSITLHLGYGRHRVGRVGQGVGFNANQVRTSEAFWVAGGARLTKTDKRRHLVATQTHHHLHSPERQIYRQGTLDQFLATPDFVKQESESPAYEDTLYNQKEYPYDGYKWAMSIDLTTCVGCNACLLACNVENNIPVVGKQQVNVNREMYWIRIDTYYKGPLDNPEFNHIPIPCMHCEHAPCELVCPVEATVHDHEGLNLMVYNRCVGTRFCSNNCPYKVRRFNFLRYTDYQTPSLKAMYNPEVTVRWRGVMEKCTYCVQRITRSRIRAEKENRTLRDQEIQTACQQACPANAIVFGDLNTPGSQVARLKGHPLDYSMLGELNTRPRTTYLAKLQNRNPEIEFNRA